MYLNVLNFLYVQTTLEFSSAVTAVAFAPSKASTSPVLLAIGFENGEIEIWKCTDASWSMYYKLPVESSHAATVRKICWRISQDSSNFEIASCSDDHSVRIHDVVDTSI